MKRLFILAVLLCIAGIAFAQPDLPRTNDDNLIVDSGRTDASADVDVQINVEKRNEERIKESRRERVNKVEEKREDGPIKREHRIDHIREYKEGLTSSCDSVDDSKKEECRKRLNVANKVRCENTQNEKALIVCENSVQRIAVNKCEDSSGNEKEDCLRKVHAYGRQYVVRERLELNDRCKNLTGQPRANCEKTVNEHFRTEVKDRYLEWKNSTKEDNEVIRQRILTSHKENLREIKEGATEKEAKLFDRLSNAIETASKKSEKMQKAIDRVKEKGHGSEDLEFLFNEYQNSLDNAVVYFDQEEYRDSVASLHEAIRYFHKFTDVLKIIVSEHKEGRIHVSGEQVFEVSE